jgi:monofunctional biosynthetic peptidoglycan transglycosylase
VFGIVLKWLLRFFLFLAVLLVALIVAYRFITPVSTLMLARYILNEKVERHFVPLKQVSPHLIAAVIVSEDARFCRHHGVDWGALREVIGQASDDGGGRGASTLTMQAAKNLFLWPAHSYVRKAFEIPIALALDAAWPKRRILEIYLNIAEWGEGIFGIETAAESYFHKHASELDPRESALLAAVLPNPRRRNAQHPSRHVAAHAKIVAARAGRAELDCLR